MTKLVRLENVVKTISCGRGDKSVATTMVPLFLVGSGKVGARYYIVAWLELFKGVAETAGARNPHGTVNSDSSQLDNLSICIPNEPDYYKLHPVAAEIVRRCQFFCSFFASSQL